MNDMFALAHPQHSHDHLYSYDMLFKTNIAMFHICKF